MVLLQSLLSSKKLQVSLAGVLIVILNDKLHLGVDSTSIIEIVGIICTYVAGQGMADFGKEAIQSQNTIVSSETIPTPTNNNV